MIYRYKITIFLLYACSIGVNCDAGHFFESLFSNDYFKDWNQKSKAFDESSKYFTKLIDEEIRKEAELFKNVIDKHFNQFNDNHLNKSKSKDEINKTNRNLDAEQEILDSGCNCYRFKCKCCTKVQVNQFISHGIYIFDKTL